MSQPLFQEEIKALHEATKEAIRRLQKRITSAIDQIVFEDDCEYQEIMDRIKADLSSMSHANRLEVIKAQPEIMTLLTTSLAVELQDAVQRGKILSTP